MQKVPAPLCCMLHFPLQKKVESKKQAQPQPQTLEAAGTNHGSGIAATIAHLFGRWARKPVDNAAAARKPVDDEEAVGKEDLGKRVDDTVGLVRGLLEKWPVPSVRLKRALQWRSDEEFGRQVSSTSCQPCIPKSLQMTTLKSACKGAMPQCTVRTTSWQICLSLTSSVIGPLQIRQDNRLLSPSSEALIMNE